MSESESELASRLRDDLRHRLRPMSGRGPGSVTPLELFYDLIYVIAFAVAADELAHAVIEGEVGAGLGAYVFAIFGVTWAWLNFTWFSSAYGNDDALFRVATVVQMVGVVIFTFGLPVSFADTAHGGSPNNVLLVVGYIIMRLPLVALWLRAAREDRDHRRTSTAYAVAITVAQVGWALTTLPGLPTGATIAALVVLAAAELVAPAVIEGRLGRAPWSAGHVAERFGLLTLITLGEVVAATVAAVGVLVRDTGWSVAAIVIAASGLVIAAGLWWAYYLVPARTILTRSPARIFPWRYAHLPLFGAIAAVGAGLRVAADGVEQQLLSLLQITLALAIPVAIVIILIFLLWSLLVGAFDLTHLPLFVCTLVPIAAAIVIAVVVDPHTPIDLAEDADLAALFTVIALVSVACVVEVVGHEKVGYSHTLRAVTRNLQPSPADSAAQPSPGPSTPRNPSPGATPAPAARSPHPRRRQPLAPQPIKLGIRRSVMPMTAHPICQGRCRFIAI
ncbi:low temperature requirement protein A [Phytohabitans houttuyneae]|uniref:Membrane protein n=1 Tax=Phytohabitans houttuyneae TaxID=1076126 RepID=A0A6V8K9Q0_9ACTN|nr:low temperature requirement protein A [Phytohabitans houttuyneae]GFJ81942.1 membrane protein [Phytohabitans houttuyneae]